MGRDDTSVPDFTLRAPSGAVEQRLLADGERLVIGRNEGADLFYNNRSISRPHCTLKRDGDTFFVSPFHQPCPTYINGVEVREATALAPGNKLRLGDFELLFDSRHRGEFATVRGSQAGVETEYEEATASSARRVLRSYTLRLDAFNALLKRTDIDEPSTTLAYASSGDGSKKLTIGRDPACSIVLDVPTVSARHAEIRMTDTGVFLVDTAATNRTLVNRTRLHRGEQKALFDGFEILLGSTRIRVTGQRVKRRDAGPVFAVETTSLYAGDLDGGRCAEPRLVNVNLRIRSGEMIVIKGFSGSGKSVLMEHLSGRIAPLTGQVPNATGTWSSVQGQVTYGGLDLESHKELLRPFIGYVPDERACLGKLTVEQWLTYAGRLRRPERNKRTLMERVTDVLADLRMTGERHKRLEQLSLGQRKRALLGAELVVDSPVLFVDEVTSNVDVGTEEHILNVLREKVSHGHTVIAITHHDVNLEKVDLTLFMCMGRLIYGGPPTRMLGFFKVEDSRDLNDDLQADADVETRLGVAVVKEQRFVASNEGREFAGRKVETETSLAPTELIEKLRAVRFPGPLAQTWTLLKRNALAFSKDRMSLFFSAFFGPFIALLIGAVLTTKLDLTRASLKLPDAIRSALNAGPAGVATLDEQGKRTLEATLSSDAFASERMSFIYRLPLQGVLVFVVVLACLLVASLQIVKEHHLYNHERLAGVRRSSWLGAKMAWMALVGVATAAGIALVSGVVSDSGTTANHTVLILLLTAISSVALGLAVSSWVPSTEAALFSTLGLIVVQLLFSGIIPGLPEGVSRGGWFIPAFYGARGLEAGLGYDTRYVIQEFGSRSMKVLHDTPLWLCVTGLLGLTGAYLGVAWLGLRRKDATAGQR